MEPHRTSESLFGNTDTSEEARTRYEAELQVRRAAAAHRGRIVTRITLVIVVIALIIGGVWGVIAHRAKVAEQAKHEAETKSAVWKPQVCGNPDARMHIKVVAQTDMTTPQKISYLLDKSAGIKPSTIYTELFYLENRPAAMVKAEEKTAEKESGDGDENEKPFDKKQYIEITVDGKSCYHANNLYSLDYNALYREVERIYRQCYPDAQYPLSIPELKMVEPKEETVPTMSMPQLPDTK
jgi:hypothetical protein